MRDKTMGVKTKEYKYDGDTFQVAWDPNECTGSVTGLGHEMVLSISKQSDGPDYYVATSTGVTYSSGVAVLTTGRTPEEVVDNACRQIQAFVAKAKSAQDANRDFSAWMED